MKWLLGIAASAAAVYYLKTASGKQLMKDIKQQAAIFGKHMKTMAGDIAKQGLTYGETTGHTVNKTG